MKKPLQPRRSGYPKGKGRSSFKVDRTSNRSWKVRRQREWLRREMVIRNLLIERLPTIIYTSPKYWRGVSLSFQLKFGLPKHLCDALFCEPEKEE